MFQLLKGNCLEILKTLENDSVDLFLLDLPFGQTDCEWDIKIELNEIFYKNAYDELVNNI